MRHAVSSFIIAAALTGCSTPYQDMGFAGGVSAQQLTSDTFRIQARGNSYTSGTAVQDYLMVKAAETTVQNGGTHFAIVSAENASSTSQIITGGTARTEFYGNSAVTRYTPPVATNIFKPGQDAYIRVLKVPDGQQAPNGAISASEILHYMGPRVWNQKG